MNRTKFLFVAIIISYIFGCEPAPKKPQKAEINNTYKTAFVIDEKDLIPEGITHDPKTDRFFLSSINKYKIIEINKDGTYLDFIESGQDSIAECLGLKVDVKKRRLWALSNEAELKYSFIHIYNLDTKELIKRLSAPLNQSNLLNDLVLTKSGDAYITDTEEGQLFYVPNDLTELQLFINPDSLLAELNGITISRDNKKLYVASNTHGISIVDIDSKSIKPIENWLSIDTRGIDGLMIYKNNLLGIRNGIRGLPGFHVAKYNLSVNGSEIISAELLDHKSDLFEVPTTGVVVGDEFYCLAVTSLIVYIVKRMDETELLNNPTVLKYNLCD